MRQTVILEKGERPGNWWKCACGNETTLNAIADSTYSSSDDEFESEYWTDSIFKILKCPACKQISIIRYSTLRSRLELDEEYTGQHYIKWNCDVVSQPSRSWHYSIPQSICDVLTQAENIVYASPRAALILCRVALEELCDAHRIARGMKLYKRLDCLVTELSLPVEITEMLSTIRIVGNEGAHGMQAVFENDITHDEAHTLIELTEFVLDRIYVDKARNKEAKEKMEWLLHSVAQVSKKGNNQ